MPSCLRTRKCRLGTRNTCHLISPGTKTYDVFIRIYRSNSIPPISIGHLLCSEVHLQTSLLYKDTGPIGLGTMIPHEDPISLIPSAMPLFPKKVISEELVVRTSTCALQRDTLQYGTTWIFFLTYLRHPFLNYYYYLFFYH